MGCYCVLLKSIWGGLGDLISGENKKSGALKRHLDMKYEPTYYKLSE